MDFTTNKYDPENTSAMTLYPKIQKAADLLLQIPLGFPGLLVQMLRKHSPNASPSFRANPCCSFSCGSNMQRHIFGRIPQIHCRAKHIRLHQCCEAAQQILGPGMSNICLHAQLAAPAIQDSRESAAQLNGSHKTVSCLSFRGPAAHFRLLSW